VNELRHALHPQPRAGEDRHGPLVVRKAVGDARHRRLRQHDHVDVVEERPQARPDELVVAVAIAV